MRNAFTTIFALLLAAAVTLAPLFCFCVAPVKAAAKVENVPPCHRHKQAGQPGEKKSPECTHCAASNIAKNVPDHPTKPASVQLATLSPLDVVEAVVPISQSVNPAIHAPSATTPVTLLRLHCALLV